MLVHLDAVGGVAGDMFIAAVTDAFPHLREGMLAAIRAAGLPESIVCRFEAHDDHALTGSRFLVDIPEDSTAAPAHGHRDFADIRTALAAAPLAPTVAERAIAIFTLLATVEGKIHGADPDAVSFHELGEWDSIADIVGAAYLIDALGADAWTIGTLPMGSGSVRTAHGPLPVPTPATALLLEGYRLVDDGIPGERITPTGAAIVRYLQCRQRRDNQPRALLRSGYGFGTKRFIGLSNVLRVLAFDAVDDVGDDAADRVAVIAFDVDDQTPEDLAVALDRLRTHPAVLDVLQMPAFGKKGRITAHIQILADAREAQTVMDACFIETTTIGLRYHVVQRRTLPRDLKVVQVGNRAVRVKVTQRPTTITAKAESDDTVHEAGFDSRAALKRAAEDLSLD
ncbi:MAG: LarC family nickel insertion protein [Burkholderiales bacterium]|nr:LarC family nickel insertion protein [Burkholderiales bacterium]